MTTDIEARKARAKAVLREKRTVTIRDLELRADGDAGDGLTLRGFASVTEAPYLMSDWAGDYEEVVRAGAFAKTLQEKADVRLLVNHEGLPLARTKSGTLQLSEVMPGDGVETSGLFCEARLDPTSPLAQTVKSAMDRGDLDEMSFMFRVTRQQWSPDYEQRDILEVELFDVSVVTFPANPAASASLRSRMVEALSAEFPLARAKAIAAELAEAREGKVLSAATCDVLQGVLDSLGDLMDGANSSGDSASGDSTADGDDSLPDDDGAEPRAADLRTFEARARLLDID